MFDDLQNALTELCYLSRLSLSTWTKPWDIPDNYCMGEMRKRDKFPVGADGVPLLVNRNPRKWGGNISNTELIHRYFGDREYEITKKGRLHFILKTMNQYGHSITIDVKFYQLCWRLEFNYTIEYKTLRGFVDTTYDFYSDEVDIDRGFKFCQEANLYLKKAIEDGLNYMVQECADITLQDRMDF